MARRRSNNPLIGWINYTGCDVSASTLPFATVCGVHIPGYPPTYSDNIRPFVPNR